MSRLIDADAYSAEMKKRQDACEKLMHDAERWNDVELMRRADSAFSVFSEAKLTLDKMPTVDAVPVVHGKWIIENTYPTSIGTHCDNCGWAWSNGIDAVKLNPVFSLIKTNYCPNCGAKMDGEEKEDATQL